VTRSQTVQKQWADVVQFYEDTLPGHRQEPMKALVRAVADAGMEASLWPGHSHFSLIASVSLETFPNTGIPVHPWLSVQHWHEVDKFELRFHHIQGIPYDEKWCELAEAQAILRHLFRRMGETNE
jgi:hypothetical protein